VGVAVLGWLSEPGWAPGLGWAPASVVAWVVSFAVVGESA
jgi:hypothetical protein